MTARSITAPASEVSGADFLRALQGKPPQDLAARQAERDRFVRISREERAAAKTERLPGESAIDHATRAYAALVEAEKRIETRLSAKVELPSELKRENAWRWVA